jgi:hypothetical protein
MPALAHPGRHGINLSAGATEASWPAGRTGHATGEHAGTWEVGSLRRHMVVAGSRIYT